MRARKTVYTIILLVSLMITGCGNMSSKNKEITSYIKNNENDKAIEMIESGYDVNSLNKTGGTLLSIFTQGEVLEYPLLYTACESGNEQMIKYLIDSGADPNLTASNLEYPLSIYLENHGYEENSVEITKKLVEAGADVNQGRDICPMCAVLNGFKSSDDQARDIMKSEIMYLLDNGIEWQNSDKNTQYYNYSILHFVAMGEDPEFLKTILQYDEAKEYINSQNYLGSTPLICAARTGRVENYNILVEAGADENIKDNDGKSAKEYLEEEK